MLTICSSAKALDCLWQELQEILLSLDKMGSKKSFFPSAILAFVRRLYDGISGSGKPLGVGKSIIS
jgi:hypothetical protein